MVVALLLDDHDLVAAVVAMTPAMVPAVIVVHAGVRTVPAVVMMTAAFDDDGLCARDRRYGDRKCANGCNDKS
jgi:hypothetical protein